MKSIFSLLIVTLNCGPLVSPTLLGGLNLPRCLREVVQEPFQTGVLEQYACKLDNGSLSSARRLLCVKAFFNHTDY